VGKTKQSVESIKAITVCQPWAWAIIHGPKRIENRTWSTNYHGWLIIHAGKSRDWLCDEINDGTRVPADQLVFGAAIGVALMDGCNWPSTYDGDPFADGPWCWHFDRVRAFDTPYKCRGSLGLWSPDDELRGIAAVHAGLFVEKTYGA
jgi:hypothetical protein